MRKEKGFVPWAMRRYFQWLPERTETESWGESEAEPCSALSVSMGESELSSVTQKAAPGHWRAVTGEIQPVPGGRRCRKEHVRTEEMLKIIFVWYLGLPFEPPQVPWAVEHSTGTIGKEGELWKFFQTFERIVTIHPENMEWMVAVFGWITLFECPSQPAQVSPLCGIIASHEPQPWAVFMFPLCRLTVSEGNVANSTCCSADWPVLFHQVRDGARAGALWHHFICPVKILHLQIFPAESRLPGTSIHSNCLFSLFMGAQEITVQLFKRVWTLTSSPWGHITERFSWSSQKYFLGSLWFENFQSDEAEEIGKPVMVKNLVPALILLLS